MRKKLYIKINETKVRENIEETQHGHWGTEVLLSICCYAL